MRGEALVAWDRTTLDVGEALGEECMAGRGADVEDALQVRAPKEMRLSVNVLMLKVKVMMKVVTVKVLLEVKVLVKVFVVKFVVEALLLFSLSSTPFPRTTPSTRPAGRVWAWILRVWVFSVRPLHPAGVVLDPFPETRPLP